MDNIIAALEHNARVCDINHFFFTNSEWEEVLAVMQQPVPGTNAFGDVFAD
jgi:hypothetical protein